MEKISENNTNTNSQNMSSENSLMEENGIIAKINGDIFNPEEVSLLEGDEMTREITQLFQFLCESYPLEAIDYCLKRCYYKGFSKTSLLDKIIKYLLDKYQKKGNSENSESLIIDLFLAYKDNKLLPKLKNISQIKSSLENENKKMTKIVFLDQSKEDVYYKNPQNEIFIEIGRCCVKDCIIPLKESEDIEIFLCERHHLYKRFCRRGEFIYVYNFNKYEKIKNKIKSKKQKKNVNENDIENNNKYEAIFTCEQKGCNAKYKYNLNNNKFNEIIPHTDIGHDEDETSPSYYQENINLLIEKPYITDIQMVICDN